MTLRTTFTGALDTKLAEAKTAGYTWAVVDNLAAITTEFTTSANKGVRKFTVNLPVSYQPEDLRLLGSLWSAYQTGIAQGLAEQDIMVNEVVIKLNTADQMTTSIDLSFSL